MKRLFLLLIILVSSSLSGRANGTDTLRVEASDSLLIDKIDSLQTVLDNLMPIRLRLAEDMLKNYGGYPTLKFKEMDVYLMDSLITYGNRLAVDNLSALMTDLNLALENRSLFVKIDSAVNIPYDREKVRMAQSLCDTLKVRVTGNQLLEVDALSKSLDKYESAIASMKDIVEWIHDTMDLYRPDGNPSAARTSLTGILNNQERIIKNEINYIPYLKVLFENLKKELQDNPLVPGETESRLIELLNL